MTNPQTILSTESVQYHNEITKEAVAKSDSAISVDSPLPNKIKIEEVSSIIICIKMFCRFNF